MTPFSLYVHIPYCFHKCPYCDFNTYAVAIAPESDYTAALMAELDYRATRMEWVGREVKTIFIGGGTPSLFGAESYRKLLSAVRRLFGIAADAEITIEANPGTVTTDSLGAYREVGINRISFGAQSFSAETLKLLGRIHSAEQTVAAFESARLAGFLNINLDLIYGIPKQTVSDWRRDLHEALRLKPDHISAYGLTFEKGTEFYTQYSKGKLRPPPEAAVIAMMEDLWLELRGSGYGHYEISNFAQVGKEARHNLAYWNGQDYLGLGAGAHSMFNVSPTQRLRWANAAQPKNYMERVTSFGMADSWQETLEAQDVIFEYFFLGLRKLSGVSISEFNSRFELDLLQVYAPELENLKKHELIEQRDDFLALTRKGLFVADSVIEQFVFKGRISEAPRIAANG